MSSLPPIRRVVTGNDAQGRSKVVWDGPAPNSHESSPGSGRGHTDIWVWYETPLPINGTNDDGNLGYVFAGPPGGGHFRVVQARALPEDYDRAKDPEVIPLHPPKPQPGAQGVWTRGGNSRYESHMHKTQTLDYGIVLTPKVLRLVRRPGLGARGAALDVSLASIAEEEDIESLATAYRLLAAQNFIAGAEGTRPIDALEAESRRHSAKVSNDLEDAVFEAAERIVGGFLADARSRAEDFSSSPSMTELRDAGFLALYRLLFILYAEARDERLIAVRDLDGELFALIGLVAWWTDAITLWGYLMGALLHLALQPALLLRQGLLNALHGGGVGHHVVQIDDEDMRGGKLLRGGRPDRSRGEEQRQREGDCGEAHTGGGSHVRTESQC